MLKATALLAEEEHEGKLPLRQPVVFLLAHVALVLEAAVQSIG
jgi:hypothetical protein